MPFSSNWLSPIGVAIALWLITTTVSADGDGEGYMQLNVDPRQKTGLLKPLRGVNGVPVQGLVSEAGADPGPHRPEDISAGYRAARVKVVRTHDSGGDIDRRDGTLPALKMPRGSGSSAKRQEDVIFPNLAADPSDPASYNFAATDKIIDGIRALGADVIFRLGRGGGTTAEPPSDLVKYGQIIRHIVLHYNKGWDNGLAKSVKYWEVWNEPDLGQIWWRGTPEQYYSLYASAAQAVKQADDTALVGGPTTALVNETQPYRDGFLDYVRDKKLPLDFFSWHYYSDANDPFDFVRIGKEMHRLLAERGLSRTLNVLDEWNASVTRGMRSVDAAQAAFVASARIYMENSPVDLDAFYRADGDFGPDGNTPNKVGQALVAWGKLADTPERIALTGGDTLGFAAIAGRSIDGGTIQVLISNYEIPEADRGPRRGPDVFVVPDLFTMKLPSRRSVSYGHNQGYDLVISGLRSGARFKVDRYRITDSTDFNLVGTVSVTGPVARIRTALPPPAIELLIVRQE